MDRAYSILRIKSVDGDARTFRGVATTPTPDRDGDIIEPLGVRFKNPVPLLMHHDRKSPVGSVQFFDPTPDGVEFQATIPNIESDGVVKARTDEAWHSIAAVPPLLTGVSIGFKALPKHVRPIKGGGFQIKECELCELSLVTVPANSNATIHAIKAFDLAASRHEIPSGDSDTSKKAETKMTIAEQITDFGLKRETAVAAMSALMTKSEGATLDADDAEKYDAHKADVASIDAHIARLKDLEAVNVKTATPIAPIAKTKAASDLRGGIVTVKPNVPPGTAFVRLACAKLVCNGNVFEAAEYAKRWDDSTPEVGLALKAAVAPGTATDPTWASPLVNQGISNDFLELLRAATILGKIPNLRKVPFNTKVPSQTAGGTYGWVGESKPKPVTKLAFSSTALGIAKAAGIIVLTEELVRLSNPSAEELVRKDMVDGIARFLDSQFIDPAVAAVAGVNPASVTNGAPTAAATGSPLADILGLINHFATNNISVEGLTFILNAANALALSFRSNLDGSPQFPGVNINGGSWKGLNFIVSNTVGSNVVAMQPNLILFADEGGVSIDASREASLQMDSAPASPADATTVYVSLWQTNCVGLRAERFVNWLRANANAVKYLTAANWPAPTGAAMAPADEPHNAGAPARKS